MAIPLPNLDDRTWRQLVDEGREQIAAIAPEWTIPSVSDPGITFLELFAFYIELLIYRTNQVARDDILGFLRLLNGSDWNPSTIDLSTAIRETIRANRSPNRAVSVADFEKLALDADPRVARVKCVPGVDLSSPQGARYAARVGHMSVVVLLSETTDPDDLMHVISSVAAYLEPRRLVTTRVHITGPTRIPFRINIAVVPRSGVHPESAHKHVSDALVRFFDPWRGAEGSGWPFGRPVYISEIYRLLNDLPGIDYVTRLPENTSGTVTDELALIRHEKSRLVTTNRGRLVGLLLQPDELPSLDLAGSVLQVGID